MLRCLGPPGVGVIPAGVGLSMNDPSEASEQANGEAGSPNVGLQSAVAHIGRIRLTATGGGAGWARRCLMCGMGDSLPGPMVAREGESVSSGEVQVSATGVKVLAFPLGSEDNIVGCARVLA